MSIVDVENLRLHYARTLAHWGARFAAIDEQVRARYGETFRRAWELYLAGSEAAFAAGSLQLFQVVFSPMETAPPYWARAEMYARGDARSERPPAVMVRCDALIVGGGPAGSTCARVAPAGRLARPRHGSRAVSARQGLRRLGDARRVPPARSRSCRLPRDRTDHPGHHRLPHLGDGRSRDRDALRAHHQLRHPPVRVRRLPAEPIGRATCSRRRRSSRSNGAATYGSPTATSPRASSSARAATSVRSRASLRGEQADDRRGRWSPRKRSSGSRTDRQRSPTARCRSCSSAATSKATAGACARARISTSGSAAATTAI